ncbi:MAG: hypothetical protein IKA87_01980 [Lentisphaeria bacterium]|nr:hypothetical protein [Lentisphaeria bacterium]
MSKCPYCNIEVRESAIESEDGCCPECGAMISAPDLVMGDDELDEDEFDYEDDQDDIFGDLEDDDEFEHISEFDDDEYPEISDDEFDDEEFDEEDEDEEF